VPTVGTSLFSLTPDQRAGADLLTVLERVAAADCGPALEVIGHQSWRGFPRLGVEVERAFRLAVDRLGLVPVALGVYADLYRRPGRTMGVDEAMDDLRPQLDAAVRLGFAQVRTALGMSPELLRLATREAEQLGLVLTLEVQGATPPNAQAVLDVLELQSETGTPHLGLTLDFSLSTPALPASLPAALRRLGAAGHQIAAIQDAWALQAPVGARIGTALSALAGHPAEQILTNLVVGIFIRTGQQQPADWADVLPVVRHAHAKFWEADVEALRTPFRAWLNALDDAGYSGAVVAEWGGHELLDSVDADALTVTRAHVGLLRELVAERAQVAS
jgi:hypothetical protein